MWWMYFYIIVCFYTIVVYFGQSRRGRINRPYSMIWWRWRWRSRKTRGRRVIHHWNCAMLTVMLLYEISTCW
ncbi:hypothetical protein BDC45DRAFT_504890 [Circinella umbellata]|nr:hypothetical protein BDC45DRAFT_504890 [Circinella umbellata]